MARKHQPTTIRATYDDTMRAEYARTGRTERLPSPPPAPEPAPPHQNPAPRRTSNYKVPARIRVEKPATLAIDGVPTSPDYKARTGRNNVKRARPKTELTRAERDRLATREREASAIQNALEEFARRDEA